MVGVTRTPAYIQNKMFFCICLKEKHYKIPTEIVNIRIWLTKRLDDGFLQNLNENLVLLVKSTNAKHCAIKLATLQNVALEESQLNMAIPNPVSSLDINTALRHFQDIFENIKPDSKLCECLLILLNRLIYNLKNFNRHDFLNHSYYVVSYCSDTIQEKPMLLAKQNMLIKNG